MKIFSRLLLIAVFSSLLALLPACMSADPASQPESATAITSSPTAESDPIHTTAPLPDQAADTENAATANPEEVTPAAPEINDKRTQYRLTAVLDYDQHYLLVDEQILYTNRQQQEIPDLRLMVDPLYYPGVFALQSIAWGDGQPVDGYAVENGQISIPLSTPLKQGESIELSINYELRLPSPVPSGDVRPVPFGYTSRQTNLVDWYPFIPPYHPETGWQAHQAGFFGEHLVYDLADFEVSIKLNSAAISLSSGEQEKSSLKIAASAPAEVEGDWYNYRHEAARNFAWSASSEYQVISTTVGNTTILSYAFPFHEAASEAVLRTTAESLGLYNTLYEPYPRQLITVVEADFLDGMEYDGLYFLSNGFYNLYQGQPGQGQPGDYLTAIAAHETAHQWFYAMVGNDQAMEPWLDEALCTYHERIYYENLHPEALDWWWEYRIDYYDPQGWVDGSIYNPLGYRAYRDAVYLNGAVFLEELRELVGASAFFAFLADYVKTSKDSIATGDDFFDILDRHTDQDLTSLLERYFQSR